jgi:alanine-synthesizing transaminase
MRFEITRSGSGLTYDIRGIVHLANRFKAYGLKIIWENIGDPVEKGEHIPDWMKDVVAETIKEDRSFAYSPTKGVDDTRQFLAERVNKRGKAQIKADDIIFFNGLGDAIARSYSSLQADARVIMPEPTYSTHYMAEVLHASFPPHTYRRNPEHNWSPDISDIEQKVKSEKSIVGILLINPDNPTGFVYPAETLRQVVRIARDYDLFLIVDETYNNIIYNGQKTAPISDLIEGVPAIIMKGISKEFPWPGSRCGWLEVYNADKDSSFARFVNAIYQQKMSEVCATTLPQMTIPRMMTHPEYQNYLSRRINHYEKLSNIAYDILKDVPYLIVNRTNGAFYMSAVFRESALNNRQTLPVEHKEIRECVEKEVSAPIENDKRFVYYLLAATGICIVPLTSFFTPLPGFRMTLLDKNEEEFKQVVKTIAEKIVEYVESAK